MECEDVYARLKTLDIHVAYDHFNEPPSVPFAAYRIAGRTRRGSDSDENLIEETEYNIELYTDHKCEELEEKVMELFPEYELSIDEIYIPEQQLYQVLFSFKTIMKTTRRHSYVTYKHR